MLPTQDRICSPSLCLSHYLWLSHYLSLCLSAYLLTKELSLCLSGRIVLNGDFLCNHLIIHQFPKKPQRGCVSTLCWRAEQWDREGKGRDFLEEMIKMDLSFFTCYRYLHSVWFLALPSSVFLERELIPISFWYSSSSSTCHRLSFYLHYNRQPGFVIGLFWHFERAGASACMHLHRALWRLKFTLNRCFFFLLWLCLACVWQICCINSQGRPGAGMFVERQITHQSFI